MAGVSEDCGAFEETVVFLGHFEELPDGRQAGKVCYPLSEVLLLCLLAVLAGAETICDIARFGDKKLALLRRFRPFEAGTRSHDHLGDILATLEAEAFQSLALPANQMGAIIRSHWAVENSLHWVMDMVFRDDECRVRTDHAPANFTPLKHMATNLLRRAASKDSLRLKRKVASWDDDFLVSLIA